MNERWLPALGLGALLLIVPMLLCVGLSGDDDEGTPERPPRSRVTSDDDELVDEAEPEAVEDELVEEDEIEDEAEREPPMGERELYGVVRDADGEVVPGAEVMRQGGSRYDETNEQGRYELGSLPAAELVLTVRAPGYRLAEVACEDGEDEQTETNGYGRFELSEAALGCPARATHGSHGASAQVTLVAGPDNRLALTTPGSIRGVVVDPEGRPVTTFLVAVASYMDASGQPGPATYRQTFSHPQGKFTMSQLAAGRYVLEIARRGAEVRTKAIEVKPGGEAAVVRVVME